MQIGFPGLGADLSRVRVRLGLGNPAWSSMDKHKKSLYKAALDYCLAHDTLVECEAARARIPSTITLIKVIDATNEFNRKKAILLKKVPSGATLHEVIESLSRMVQETYAHDLAANV